MRGAVADDEGVRVAHTVALAAVQRLALGTLADVELDHRLRLALVVRRAQRVQVHAVLLERALHEPVRRVQLHALGQRGSDFRWLVDARLHERQRDLLVDHGAVALQRHSDHGRLHGLHEEGAVAPLLHVDDFLQEERVVLADDAHVAVDVARLAPVVEHVVVALRQADDRAVQTALHVLLLEHLALARCDVQTALRALIQIRVERQAVLAALHREGERVRNLARVVAHVDGVRRLLLSLHPTAREALSHLLEVDALGKVGRDPQQRVGALPGDLVLQQHAVQADHHVLHHLSRVVLDRHIAAQRHLLHRDHHHRLNRLSVQHGRHGELALAHHLRRSALNLAVGADAQSRGQVGRHGEAGRRGVRGEDDRRVLDRHALHPHHALLLVGERRARVVEQHARGHALNRLVLVRPQELQGSQRVVVLEPLDVDRLHSRLLHLVLDQSLLRRAVAAPPVDHQLVRHPHTHAVDVVEAQRVVAHAVKLHEAVPLHVRLPLEHESRHGVPRGSTIRERGAEELPEVLLVVDVRVHLVHQQRHHTLREAIHSANAALQVNGVVLRTQTRQGLQSHDDGHHAAALALRVARRDGVHLRVLLLLLRTAHHTHSRRALNHARASVQRQSRGEVRRDAVDLHLGSAVERGLHHDELVHSRGDGGVVEEGGRQTAGSAVALVEQHQRVLGQTHSHLRARIIIEICPQETEVVVPRVEPRRAVNHALHF